MTESSIMARKIRSRYGLESLNILQAFSLVGCNSKSRLPSNTINPKGAEIDRKIHPKPPMYQRSSVKANRQITVLTTHLIAFPRLR